MNKIIRFIQNYLICALPFVVACMIWETFQPEIQFEKSILWQILSLNLILWFVVLILFLISMVTMSSVCEKTLQRLANLRERDEREQYIMGKAARAAYISTLSLVILFLFFSMVSFQISTIPKNEAVNSQHIKVSIEVNLSLLKKDNSEMVNKTSKNEIYFDSNKIVPSTSTILLFLLCWQILIFNLVARKELK